MRILASLLFATSTLAPLQLNAQALDRVRVVVGEHAILDSEIKELSRQMLATPALAGLYQIRVDKNQPAVVESEVQKLLINEAVVKEALKELKIEIGPTEVDSQISKIASQNSITAGQLLSSVTREGLSVDLYKKNIRAQLERQAVFEREIRGGGGVAEAELRQIFREQMGQEVQLYVVIEGGSASARKKLDSLKGRAAGQENLSQFAQKNKATSIGWISLGGLRQEMRDAITGGQAGTVRRVAGPILSGGKWQLLIVADVREGGSEEEFQKAKEQIKGYAQMRDFQSRYESWLEQKKQSLQIVVNP